MYDRHVRFHHPPGELTLLGETAFRGTQLRFGLESPDRLRHVYILGKTGVGKSTLMLTQIAQDLARGHGLALFDPHGSLVDEVLGFVPRSRTEDVVLIESGAASVPALNVFRAGRTLHPDVGRFTTEFVSCLRRVWKDSWGPRLEHILRAGTLAVAAHPRASVMLLYRFFVDEALRKKVVERSTDAFVRTFWLREWASYSKSLQAEALSPILNKLGTLVSPGPVASLLASERSRFDAADILASGRIVLAKLSVGELGDEGSALVGSILLSLIQLAAFRRTMHARPFYLYLDEFQRFAGDGTRILLAEGRKYGIGLVLAHQFLAQLDDDMQAAVLGNVGTKVIFRVGADDAETLAPGFEPQFTRADLEARGAYEAAVKLLSKGLELPPFSARTVRPDRPASAADLGVIRREALRRHGVSRTAALAHRTRTFPLRRDPPHRPATRRAAPSGQSSRAAPPRGGLRRGREGAPRTATLRKKTI